MGKVNEREALNEMMEIGWICWRESSMRDDGDRMDLLSRVFDER